LGVDAKAAHAATPHLRIRPPGRWAALNLREVWNYRDLLMTLAWRDVKLRYRQTALGAVWVVFQPLMAAGIFTVIFGRVAQLGGGPIPYFVLSFAGMMAWGLFSGTVTKSSTCLIGNAHLVSKIYFPRLVLPLSTVFGVLIDFAVSFGLMAFLMASFPLVPPIEILLLPVWMLLLLMIALGIGFFAAALTVSYRDVQYVLPVMVQFLLYASPVGYSLEKAMEKLPASFHWFFLANPLSGLLEAFRWSLLGMAPPPPGLLAYSAGFAFVVFILGAFSFRRMERNFADVI
jgi:lipopolysaccharide transport system permease protein